MKEKRSTLGGDEVCIRPARREDCATMVALVRELAAYEGLLEKVEARERDFLSDGFGERPYFECLLAETPEGAALGFALFYHGYSTFAGKPTLFVEDLYLREAARGLGLGRRLLAELARLALARNCLGLELSVLDWNRARGFYERLGFRHHVGWLTYRLSGEDLPALAASGH